MWNSLELDERTAVSEDAGGIAVDRLEALRGGDHQAFQQVYLHYAGSIRKFLQVLVRSEEEAREITQEVFVALWEKRERIDPRKNIKSYLYMVARNTALNYFEHKKVHDKYYAARMHEIEASLPSDEILISKETELLIEMAVSRMPEQRKKIFRMRRYEDLSVEEIARQLGLSKKTVESHLLSAKRDLREVIAVFMLFLGSGLADF